MAYEKPIITLQNDLAEGVYAASGDNLPVCQSQYMMGVYHNPTSNTYGATISRIDRGCEGCPAAQGGECRRDLGPFGNSLMPTWERNGYDPKETFVYWG